MEDKISIIIPIYNVELYLKKCIESIIKQSYKNIEIILINDGSTDKSEIICKKYQKQDNRIKIIAIKNGGVSNARNLGIEASTGKYIAFIDSDDTVDKKYIEELLICIKKYQCDVVFCLAKYIYPELNRVYNCKLENQEKLSEIFTQDYRYIVSFFHTPWGKLYKSDIIKKYNIKFPVDLFTGEDQIFNQEYLKYVKSYNYVNKNLYNYYIRKNNSISKNLSEKNFLSDIKCLKLKKFFLSNELNSISKIDKDIYLLNHTKFLIYKYWILQKINKEELKKIKTRLNKIKEIMPLTNLSIINMTLKEKIVIFFLRKDIWIGVYIIAFIKYIKKYIKNND